MLHHRVGARFPPDVILGIQAKEFNLGFIKLESRYVHFTKEWLPSGLIGGALQRWLSFWKVLPSLQRNSGAVSE
jgi:hypothetical protein